MRNLPALITFLAGAFCVGTSACGSGKGNSDSSTASPRHVQIDQGTESSAGGGIAVVCFNDPGVPDKISAAGGDLEDKYMAQISSVEMLDLYQAKESRGLDSIQKPEFFEADGADRPFAYASRTAKRFARFIPGLTRLLDEGSRHFPENAILHTQVGLMKVEDSKFEERIPKGCVAATMAVQTGTDDQSLLKIDDRLFFHSKHSNLSRGVLVLHEWLFYVMARKFGQKDSGNVRKIVGYLITKAPQYRMSELVTLLRQQHWESNFDFSGAPEVWLTDALRHLSLLAENQFEDYLQLHKNYRSVLDDLRRALKNEQARCGGLLGYRENSCFGKPDEEFNRIADQASKFERQFTENVVPILNKEWEVHIRNTWPQIQPAWFESPEAMIRWENQLIGDVIPKSAAILGQITCEPHDCDIGAMRPGIDYEPEIRTRWTALSHLRELPDPLGPPLSDK